MELLDRVASILEYGPICDHCLGRMFGKRSHGLGNDERGRALRITGSIAGDVAFAPEQEVCWICNGLFAELDLWADRVAKALEGIEFDTLLIGCRVPPLIAESEEMVWTDLSLTHPEPLKAEFNREVGKRVSARTGHEVDFTHPDVVAIADLAAGEVEVQVSPLFIYGRYWKYERGIPQTRWHCRVCRGEGCERCGFTGRMYADSVEELIGRPLIEIFSADDAVLHGAGREDIDARMLGTGRPFVIEVVAPITRRHDLTPLEDVVNRSAGGRVAVVFDHWSDRREVETIKSEKAYKKYSILVEIDGAFSKEEVQTALKTLEGVTIHQRTPARVSHRRSDRVRKRRVKEIECVGVQDCKFLIEVLGEAGLYIKELISGDDGRTTPSLSGVLGAAARVTSLDVVLVEAVVPETRPQQMKTESGEYGTS
ncbi:MAG TPA: tRNA pseudouridine(54/55) synthase Pus10 [Methanoculleus sp.]|nr:tRNA pseudouridine(54/55) synthase Pus10 [Methanoculleus sp.]